MIDFKERRPIYLPDESRCSVRYGVAYIFALASLAHTSVCLCLSGSVRARARVCGRTCAVPFSKDQRSLDWGSRIDKP
jgi:hypothetical protein